jgi:hypothetical protein
LTFSSKDINEIINEDLHLGCNNNLCLVAFKSYTQQIDPKRIRIVAQLKENNKFDLAPVSVRSSDIFPIGERNADHKTFNVKVAGNTLDIALSNNDAVERWQIFQERLFWESLLLTVAIELTIWSGYLWWQQTKLIEILLTDAIVLTVHAFSFPIVWYVFPSFRAFASNFERATALLWLGLSLCYGFLPFVLRSQQSTRAGGILAGSLLYWFGSVVVTAILGFFSGYGYSFPSATGLPMPFLTLASELFVVGYEAWIVYRLRQDSLSLKLVLKVSFAANAVSCLVGLVFFFTIFKY